MLFGSAQNAMLKQAHNIRQASLEQRKANTAATDASTAAAIFATDAAKKRLGWEQKDWLASQTAAAGMGDSMTAMIDNYNQAYGQAKQSNEDRYNQMLGIADQTTGQRQADVTSAYNQQSSNAMQQLARSGMGNTTVAPTMQMGFEREKQASLDRTADEMQQTRLGIMERKEDSYPDRASLQSILAGAASGTTTPQVAAMLKALGNIQQ